MGKILLGWSSGKDSAWTLHVLRQQGANVGGLLTTLNEAAGRVAMHGVRRSLLEEQAAAAGVALWQVALPWPCTNEAYEAAMAETCRRAVAEGFDEMAFGDLYLRDVRAYRERQLAGSGLRPVFPLWEIATDGLAREMMAGGLRARLACVDTAALGEEFAGREFDEGLLGVLPAGVDPCGENGEFHTFAYGGPMFGREIRCEVGERHWFERFLYVDLVGQGGSEGAE